MVNMVRPRTYIVIRIIRPLPRFIGVRTNNTNGFDDGCKGNVISDLPQSRYVVLLDKGCCGRPHSGAAVAVGADNIALI